MNDPVIIGNAMTPYIPAFLVSFLYVALKAFQQQHPRSV